MKPYPLLIAVPVVFFTGCSTSSYNKIMNRATETTTVTDNTFKSMASPVSELPIAVESEKFWVSKNALLVKDEGLPETFYRNLQLNFEPKTSLRDITTSLSRSAHMRFSFSDDIQSESDKPILLSGFSKSTTPKGFLDYIAALPNPALSWQYKDGEVEIFRYRTQVFKLDIPKNDSTFKATISNKNASGGSGGGSGSSGGSSAVTSSMTGHEVTVDGASKFWTGIEAAIKQMLTEKTGKVSVSRSTGDITVTDTPQALNAIAKYIKTVNYNATRKIYLMVQVMSVESSSADNYGINWSAVYGALSTKYNISLSTPSIVNAASNGGGITAVLNDPSKLGTTAQAIASVLTSMGRSTKLATYPLWALSGTPTHASVVRDQSYAQSVSVTPATVAGASPTQSITPGVVTTGISLHSTASVMSDNQIMLEESIEVSTLDAMETFGKIETGQIQTPTKSKLSFLPTTTLRNGETLMLAGMRDLESNVKQNGIGSAENEFAVGTTGNRAGTTTSKSFVLLITPYLM